MEFPLIFTLKIYSTLKKKFPLNDPFKHILIISFSLDILVSPHILTRGSFLSPHAQETRWGTFIQHVEVRVEGRASEYSLFLFLFLIVLLSPHAQETRGRLLTWGTRGKVRYRWTIHERERERERERKIN